MANNGGAALSILGFVFIALGAVLLTAGNNAVGVTIMATGPVFVAAGWTIDRKSHPPGAKK